MKFYQLIFEVSEWNEEGQFSAENSLWFQTKEAAEKEQKEINDSKDTLDWEWKDDPHGMYGYECDEGTIFEMEIPTDDMDKMESWLGLHCSAQGARPDLFS